MKTRTLGKNLEVSTIGVGGWGVSKAPHDYVRRAHAVCPITAVKYYYSITNRSHEGLFGFLEQEGIGWIASTLMGEGLLSGAFGHGATSRPYFSSAARARSRARICAR